MSDPALTVQVTPLGGGRFLVIEGSVRRIAYAVKAGGARWVFLDGRTFSFDSAAGAAAVTSPVHDDEAALSSPMPATVTAIRVAPGSVVTRGDIVIVLEAMKMELAIRAPRDGRVRAINCREGELVHPGNALLELEPPLQ